MEQENNDLQWEHLLEDAFGSRKASGKKASAVPEETPTTVETPAVPNAPKRPFYRKAAFWLTLALVLVTGLSAWLLYDKFQSQQPQVLEDPIRQEAMELCKNALAAWQEEEYYHMIQENYSYGGGIDTTLIQKSYWRSGEDFSFTVDYPEGMGLSFQRYLKRDDTLFMVREKQSETDQNLTYYNWEIVEDTENIAQRLTPWPMMFDWDRSEIVPQRISTSKNRYSVSFAVRRDGSEFAEQLPYYVNFKFTGDKQLTSITVVKTSAEEGLWSSLTATTYQMITCTEQRASDKIMEIWEWPGKLSLDELDDFA